MSGQPDIYALQERLPWARELRQKFAGGISHTFIIHGAVDDYVCEYPVKLNEFFTHMFAANPDPVKRRLVVFYDRSRGIDFASPAMRKPFMEAAGVADGPREAGEKLLPEPHRAIAAIEQAMLNPQMQGKLAVVINFPELIWPDGNYGQLHEADRFNLATLRRWATSSEFIAAAQVIMLVTGAATDLHNSLRQVSSGIESIEIPYPSLADRQQFVVQTIARKRVQLADNITPPVFAQLTGGLSRVLIEDICLRASVEQRPVDYPLIKERKDHIIRQEFGELIEILEPRIGFAHVGGLEEVKRYLTQSVVMPLRSHDPAVRARIPSGVLFVGPPGTGKTLLVSALAREAGVNVVKLNAGRLLGQYVGNSERNLEKALTCIRSLAPTIVLIDEIEQQFQRGGAGDGGVERRIFGRLLEEMSGTHGSRRGDVIWFAATNRVDLLDSALKRRFDRTVPILPPSDAERLAILKTKLPQGTTINPAEEQALAQATSHYTGSDLDSVMVKAAEIAGGPVAARHVLEALTFMRPSNAPDDVEKMIDVALDACNDWSLVPETWRSRAQQ